MTQRANVSKLIQQKEARQDKYLRVASEEWQRLGDRHEAEQLALDAIGISKHAVQRWRDNEPAFRRRYNDMLRRRKKHNDQGGFPDFLDFRERHFAYIDRNTNRVVRATNFWYQSDASTKLDSFDRQIMVLPPGHAKTTLFAIERPTYEIMKDRNWRGLVSQKSEVEARKVVAAVQERLECDYYHWFIEKMTEQGDDPIECPVCRYSNGVPFKPSGRQSGDKWGANGFRVEGRTSGEKDDTFQAKGAGAQILGVRSDYIVLDDIQDPLQAMRSMQDTENLVDWFHAVILGRLYSKQKLVVLANFYAPDDFAHRLIDRHPEWPVTKYPAITNDATQDVLVPELWTYKELIEKKKEVGDQVWHYTWMQEEGSFDSQVFKREMLEEAKDEDYVLGDRPGHVTHLFLGVDPAISKYCAIVAWGLDIRTGQRFLVDVFNRKGLRTFSNIQSACLDLAARHGAVVAAIEMNNVQGSISNDPGFLREMRNAGCKVTTYQTRTETGARAEHDAFDISSIGTLFDRGLVTLPYGGTKDDREKVDKYVEQLLQWRPGVKYLTRDMVMATLFAESEAYPVAARGRNEKKPYTPRVPKFVSNRAQEIASSVSRGRAPV